MEISLNNYDKILSEIQRIINLAKDNITKTVNQEKVLMSWHIGESIEKYLITDDRAEYGVQLISQLEKDLSISRSTLYQMRGFYKTYPNLKEQEMALNWSHYRSLITIKDQDERQYFENLTLENNLNSRDLQLEITKKKDAPIKKVPQKISPSRGEVFNYKLTTIDGSDKNFIDCGFNIFSEIKTDLTPPLLVKSNKGADGKITLIASQTPKSKLYTYKAYLEKVVDGDTLRVVLDLGFGIYHKEILRLKGINAAEMTTLQGRKSAEALKKILQNVEFLVIKTNKIDIYGRYVADVFFGDKNDGLKEVAEQGVYLNQLLLDENLAEIY